MSAIIMKRQRAILGAIAGKCVVKETSSEEILSISPVFPTFKLFSLNNIVRHTDVFNATVLTS